MNYNYIKLYLTKTILCVPTQTPCNVQSTKFQNTWGIGDVIRGIICLFNLSKQLGCELIVDFSLHPISKLLKQPNHKFSSIVEAHRNTIPFIQDIDNFVPHVLDKYEYVVLCTNGSLACYNTPCSPELSTFIQNLFIPNEDYQNYIDSQMLKIPFHIFDVSHYRLGDMEFLESNPDYSGFVKHFQKYNNSTKNYVLLSDSLGLKKTILNNKTYTNVFAFPDKASHLGYETNVELVKQTLFEFLLLSKAQSIQTYSVYCWISGFVQIANYVYGIPLIDLKSTE